MRSPSRTNDPHPGPGPAEEGSDPGGLLQATLARVRRRALSMGAGAALAGGLAVALAVSLPVAFVLGAADLERLGDLTWLQGTTVVALLATLLAGLAYFFQTHWRRLATDQALALHLERTVETTRGLASAVEFRAALDEGEGVPLKARGASEDLARAHVEEVARTLADTPIEPALPRQTLGRALLALAALGIVALVAILLPGSPLLRGYQRLFTFERGIARLEGSGETGPALITGDISLTYHYPAYTRRPPRTVSGTGGAITALPGTEVEIRTTADRPVAAANLLVGENAFPLEVKDHRALRGTLLVREAGSYRFRFLDARGRTLAEGAPHPIRLEADAWPEVTLEVPSKEEGGPHIEVERDEVLDLRWSAEDDFGVGKVALVYRIGGGEEKRIALEDAAGKHHAASGHHAWPLATLNLSPGEQVAVHVEAEDNDVVSGPKVGRSRTFTLEVFSEVAHRRALIEEIEQVWKAMLGHLADHLEGPFDADAERDDDALTRELDRMGTLATALEGLSTDLRELQGRIAADPVAPPALAPALHNITRGLALPARRLSVTLRNVELRVGGTRSRLMPLLRELARAQARVVAELEKDILYLEDLLDQQRLTALEELARSLAESKRRLEHLIDRLKTHPSEEVRREIAEEIQRLKERIFELMRRMQELAKSIRDEHLNFEALKEIRRNEDLLSRLDEMQRLLNEGSLDEALARLQEMGEQIDRLLERFQKGQDELGGEKYEALRKEINAFRDELERLRHGQERALQASRRLRERYQKALEAKVAGKLDELARRLEAKAEAARSALDHLPEKTRKTMAPIYDPANLDEAITRLAQTKMLLEARDFDEALKEAQKALRNVSAARSFFQDARQGRQRLLRTFLPGVRSTEALERALGEVEGRLGTAQEKTREVVEALEALFPDPRTVFDESERERLARLGKEEESLRQRASQLEKRMEHIGEMAPIFSPEMEGNLRQASRHMSEAARRLAQSDARGATGQERAALDRLAELAERMEQAAQQGGGGVPMPMAMGDTGMGGSGAFGRRREKVEIPDPDAYKAPEAFRKELLEAMKEGAPARYQEQVRRYYEELVR